MKKVLILLLVSVFLASPAMAVSWYWDLSGTDFLVTGSAPSDNPPGPVVDNDTLLFVNDLGSVSVTGQVSSITQSLGGDGILNNDDTFSEFGALAILDADNVSFTLLDRSDPGTILDPNTRVAYVTFTGLTGSILNYDNGDDGLDTTIGNYGDALADDSFDLTFDPFSGSIKFFLDDDYDPDNAGNTLQIAELELLAGEGTSPEFILNAAEGQFGLQAGFVDVLAGFWNFADDKAFEDIDPLINIIASSFNLGATVASIGDDGQNALLFGVLNEGSWQINVVPEPSTFLLLGAGLLGLGFLARRRKQ